MRWPARAFDEMAYGGAQVFKAPDDACAPGLDRRTGFHAIELAADVLCAVRALPCQRLGTRLQRARSSVTARGFVSDVSLRDAVAGYWDAAMVSVCLATIALGLGLPLGFWLANRPRLAEPACPCLTPACCHHRRFPPEAGVLFPRGP